MELLPEVQQQLARSAVQSDLESPQPATLAVEEHRLPPLASPLFGHARGNLMRESMAFEESNLPSTSAWAGYSQPSSAHERLGLRSPAPSSPLLSNMNFPKINGPTPAREFVALGESPVQGRRLRYEAEQPGEPSLYPTIDIGDVQRGDGLDAAGPGSWASGVEKRMPVKMNGIAHLGNGSPVPLENGLRADGLHADANDTMEMDLEGTSNWPSNGKRHPSDRSWLQRTGEKEASRDFTVTGIDAENGPLSTGILPWESSKGNAEADENGGSRWRSDEGSDEAGPTHTPSTRLKALSQSQGRSRSRFYSFRV